MTLYVCDRCGVLYLRQPVDGECRLALAVAPSTATRPSIPQACLGDVRAVGEA